MVYLIISIFFGFIFPIATYIYYTRKFYENRLSGSLNKYLLKRVFSIGLIPVYLAGVFLLIGMMTVPNDFGISLSVRFGNILVYNAYTNDPTPGLAFVSVLAWSFLTILPAAIFGLMIGYLISSRIVKKHSVVIEKQTTQL